MRFPVRMSGPYTVRGDIIARMVTDAIHTRRSIQRYTSQPVQPDLIDQLFDAATRAPSSYHSRPRRFLTVIG